MSTGNARAVHGVGGYLGRMMLTMVVFAGVPTGSAIAGQAAAETETVRAQQKPSPSAVPETSTASEGGAETQADASPPADASAAVETTQASEAEAQAVVAPGPGPGPESMGTGPAGVVTDQQVYGLLNHYVDALMADASHILGVLIGYDPDYVILEDPETLQRFQVDRKMISGIRMAEAPVPLIDEYADPAVASPGHARPPRSYQRQTGKVVAGAIVTAGGAVLVGTLGVLLFTGDDEDILLPVSLLAAAHLSVGIPILVSGVRANRRYRRWQDEQSAALTPTWMPSMQVGREGVRGGVKLRF